MRENLYFIAIVPETKVSEKIIQIQKDISHRFDCKAALKVEPYITLKLPFRFPAGEHQNVIEWFKNMDAVISSFVLELKDFGAFPDPNQPVIYIEPAANVYLMNLQKQIIQQFRDSFPFLSLMSIELNFKPHLTVAYRDLKPKLFAEAWEEFRQKQYSVFFEVKEFWLMQHNDGHWNRIRSHALR